MKKIILLSMFSIFAFSIGFSQCKMITKQKQIERIEKRVPLEIEVISKGKMLFDKYFTVASNSFLKTSNGDYFYMVYFTRGYSSRFEANEDTPMVFYLDNGEELMIHPLSSIDGKMLGVGKYNIFLHYKINKEQLEILASSYPVSLKIYFIAEKEISNSYIDDIGTYFEYELYSEKYKNNVVDGANCILQY